MPERNDTVLEVDMEGIREIFKIKLCREFLQFMEFMLSQDKGELFDSCYKIDVYRNCYEMTLALVERLSEEQLEVLYGTNDILGWLYRGWIKKEDCCFREMQQYVEKMILQVEAQGKDGATDGGTKDCQTAECRRD